MFFEEEFSSKSTMWCGFKSLSVSSVFLIFGEMPTVPLILITAHIILFHLFFLQCRQNTLPFALPQAHLLWLLQSQACLPCFQKSCSRHPLSLKTPAPVLSCSLQQALSL